MIDRADFKTIWLLGDPVGHSMSPLIQNTALRLMGEKIVYLAARVIEEDFARVARTLPALGAIGANVTVPHKLRAFELCDTLSERARKMKAVNTLKFQDDQIFGDNTDGVGWWGALVHHFGGPFRKAIVIGAGGASRAICHTLMDNGCRELVLLNRTTSKAHELRDELPSDAVVKIDGLDSFGRHLEPNTLVVQTTSVGLKDGGSPVPLPEVLPEGCILSELIYGRQTRLMSHFITLGGQVQDGLGMLCGQAAESLALWTERPLSEIPFEEMVKAARKRLGLP